MKIGIDILGGDFAPDANIAGAVLARKELPQDVTIVLIGDQDQQVRLLTFRLEKLPRASARGSFFLARVGVTGAGGSAAVLERLPKTIGVAIGVTKPELAHLPSLILGSGSS